MKVLVTGAAGFIGYHVARRLAETKRCEVLGVDNVGDYYDVALKRARLAELGAQPGVRYSMENPAAYTHSNLDGFASVLEACRRSPPKHLVFASSSSVYGAGAKPPYRE